MRVYNWSLLGASLKMSATWSSILQSFMMTLPLFIIVLTSSMLSHLSSSLMYFSGQPRVPLEVCWICSSKKKIPSCSFRTHYPWMRQTLHTTIQKVAPKMTSSIYTWMISNSFPCDFKKRVLSILPLLKPLLKRNLDNLSACWGTECHTLLLSNWAWSASSFSPSEFTLSVWTASSLFSIV